MVNRPCGGWVTTPDKSAEGSAEPGRHSEHLLFEMAGQDALRCFGLKGCKSASRGGGSALPGLRPGGGIGERNFLRIASTVEERFQVNAYASDIGLANNRPTDTAQKSAIAIFPRLIRMIAIILSNTKILQFQPILQI